MEPVFLIFWFWYVGILSLRKQVTIFHKDIYVFSIHSFWEFLLTSYISGCDLFLKVHWNMTMLSEVASWAFKTEPFR